MAGNNIYMQPGSNYIDIHDNQVVNLNVDKATVNAQEGGNPQQTLLEDEAPEESPSALEASPAPLNFDSPRISLQQLLKHPWFAEVRTDARYDDAWTDTLVEALMASEYGEGIARDWALTGHNDRKNLIKGYVVGLLKDNRVIKGTLRNSYAELAAKVAIVVNEQNEKKTYGTFADYMCRGKKQPYADWVKEYVKQYGFLQ